MRPEPNLVCTWEGIVVAEEGTVVVVVQAAGRTSLGSEGGGGM